MTCGVYEVWCGPYFYQGSSKNIESRWAIHRRDLMAGKHYNPKFQRAFNKYGWTDEAILVECGVHARFQWEQDYIDANWGDEKYLNVNPRAWGGRVPGFKQPPHVREAIAEANKRRKWSDESKDKMRSTRSGWTAEQKDEYHEKLVRRQKESWALRPPSEVQQERARTLGNRERTPEEVEFLRGLRKGVTHTSETRAKLSNAKLGKPHSAEHKARIAEAARKRWAKARGEE